MNPTREQALLALALEKPVEKRAAFLDAMCDGDVGLRQRLESLLAAHEQPETLLATPAEAARLPQDTSARQARPTIKLDLADAPDEAVGQTLGRYKLLERIGEGGCGVVYVAEQTHPMRRRVALKVIKLGMDTKVVVARFEAERQALAMMDHPNIAKVLDAGATDKGRPFFVMELVRGIRITEYCDQNNLPTQERLDLFIKVCQAIQHAHQKGIIHRDIKPSNILVTLHDGVPVPKVIDFGIAKATEGRLTDATVYTQLHQFIGTPAYMSPEQAEMSGLDIDTRSDIYSLGVLLYELLAGRTPFDANELMSQGIDVMRKIIREQDPVRPSTKLGTLEGEELTTTAKRRSLEAPKLIHLLKGDLDWVVMKCLEKDRTRRYETANGLAADLKRHLNNEPVAARPPSAAYRFQKAVRRNKVVFAAGAGVVIALLGGVIVSGWQAVRATRARQAEEIARRAADQNADRAEKERARAEVEKKRAEIRELTARQTAYASDMSLIQQALGLNNLGRARTLLNRQRPETKSERPTSALDLRGWEWRYLWQQCRSDALLALCKKAGVITSLAVSHDGKWIGVNGEGLSVFDWETKEQIASLPSRGNHVAFSPRAPLLAFQTANESGTTNREYNIQLWDALAKQFVANFALGGPCVGLAFSKDGETLATYTGAPANEISLWQIPQGTKLRSFPVSQPYAGPEAKSLAVAQDLSIAAYLPQDPENRIRVIDLATGKERWSVETEDESINSLAISSDGRVLASGAFDTSARIRLWDANSGKEIGRPLVGHRAWIRDLVFWPDGKTLASASADQTIRLWDLSDPINVPPARVLLGHNLEVWSAALFPDNTRLVSGNKDGEVYVWDTSEVHRKRGGIVLDQKMAAWCFAPDSKSVVTLSRQGRLTRRRGRHFQDAEELLDVGTNFLGGCIGVDGHLGAVGSTNGVVQTWDLDRQPPLRQLTITNGLVSPLGFLARSRKLFIYSAEDSTVHELDLSEWRESRSWRTAQGIKPPRFAASADEQRVLICQGTRTLLLDTVTGRKTSLDLDIGPIDGAAFSSDGSLFAMASRNGDSASTGGLAKIWEAHARREVARFRGFLLGAHSVAFSPEGKRLAVGSSGQEAVKLWDIESKQELLTLPGQGMLFGELAFSPDGNVLGSLTYYGDVHLWRAPSWEEIAATEAKENTEGQP